MKRQYMPVFCLAMLCLPGLVAGWPEASRPAAAQATQPLTIGREALPPGVSIQTMLTNMDKPVAMSFDPQGRLFYTEKDTGNVRLFADGALQPNPVITFNVSNINERGLLGIAVSPTFNQDHYIYVFYTCGIGFGCAAPENRVARFVENNGSGSNPTTIFTSSISSDHHNGGNIHFGPDGKLYISIGDNADPATAQNVADVHGKIHRINPDGSVPSDNPVFSQPGALPSLYAMGLRNSFDFTFDPVVRGRIFASENGPGCDDEMNRIEAGYNYGWHANYECSGGENYDPAINTINPLWSQIGPCCPAPTGITVYTGNMIPQWHNHLFMSVFQDPRRLYHFYLNADRTSVTAVNLVPDIFANMDLETGPDGALWYMSGGGFFTGTLFRVGAFGAAAPPASSPVTNPVMTTTPGATPLHTHPTRQRQQVVPRNRQERNRHLP